MRAKVQLNSSFLLRTTDAEATFLSSVDVNAKAAGEMLYSMANKSHAY